MILRRFLILLISILSFQGFAQNIQSPEAFLGYELGSRFSRHHQVVDYFTYVSKASNKVQLQKYGETNEHRPLYISIISSEKNRNRIEEIRTNNLKRAGILPGTPTADTTAIVWMSYNVHGNEASSTEAAMATLYKLINSNQEWLENTVVIIDPCINPDGRDRYANWYNQTKSTPYNTTLAAKEHQEPWPGGRANHYLFDLNRDWAWATQVESSQRLQIYNQWMPHIHVDFHEQGINDPYYFAPAAEPFHEIITDWQRSFQTTIGKNHARYFDKEGWLYFTKERFDLLYPSYGDTYPTYMGAIGMTYEQAGGGRGGLGVENQEGETVTLKSRIAHHTATGLSTVEISSKNAQQLTREFSKFFKNNHTLTYQSYVLKNTNGDNTKRLKALLEKHEISYTQAKKGIVKGYRYHTQQAGKFYTTTEDLVIHANQPKGKMVQALFEPKAKLSDSLTYDITAWSLPYAYGFDAIASKNKVASTASNLKRNTVQNNPVENSYAYISSWNSIDDAAFLSSLLQQQIRVRFTEKAITVNGKKYQPGSLILLRSDHRNPNIFGEAICKIANQHQRKLAAVASGFVDRGSDFGASSIQPINQQRVAVLSGKGVSSLGFGEIWHFFETQLHYPLTVLDTESINRVDLNNYDVLILPDGYYSSILHKKHHEELQKWVRKGGTLLVIGKALQSFAGTKGYDLQRKKALKPEINNPLLPYATQEREGIRGLITGSIFKSTVDNTHPLAFGYSNVYFSLKLNSNAYAYLEDGNNVAYFAKDASNVSGFAGENALKVVPESLLFGEQQMGRGNIIYMVDNPLFRGFWAHGKLFFANAIFLSNSQQLR